MSSADDVDGSASLLMLLVKRCRARLVLLEGEDKNMFELGLKSVRIVFLDIPVLDFVIIFVLPTGCSFNLLGRRGPIPTSM